jgi:hypothetical protein
VNGVQRAFLSYDVDGSGSITRDELKEWMTRHGRFLTRRQVQMMVDAVDVNGDGEIDYAEFLVSLNLAKSILNALFSDARLPKSSANEIDRRRRQLKNLLFFIVQFHSDLKYKQKMSTFVPLFINRKNTKEQKFNLQNGRKLKKQHLHHQ